MTGVKNIEQILSLAIGKYLLKENIIQVGDCCQDFLMRGGDC